MTEKPRESQANEQECDAEELPPHWQKVHGAIWMIGLAILFWQGWIFPGILVLVGISALTQGLFMAYQRRSRQREQIAGVRSVSLPDYCPNCGGPLDTDKVEWSSQYRARCPFCGSSIQVQPPNASLPQP